MNAIEILNEICGLLETYRGRDKIMRTLTYTAKLIGCMSKDAKTQKNFNIFSSQMSMTRATLRLFDDLPMLKYSIEYGLGENEPDSIMACIGVTTNIIDQIFYPIEKVSWLAEHKIITQNCHPWDVASSVCWVTTVYLNFIKTIRYYRLLKRAKLNYEFQGNSLQATKVSNDAKMELVSIVRLIFDFIHAVNGLPSGFLWSSKLQAWQIGVVGTLSSLIGLYQMLYRRYTAKKNGS